MLFGVRCLLFLFLGWLWFERWLMFVWCVLCLVFGRWLWAICCLLLVVVLFFVVFVVVGVVVVVFVFVVIVVVLCWCLMLSLLFSL